jgi:Predicted exonuclease of the beta-lactamase fold involved in RNA processing
MVATLTFLGATGTVTGSKFLLESEGRRTMVDCGLYQGESTWRRLNWKPLPVDPESISDVVLTHAHLDHCGHLPALVRGGFAGPTWCTHGTAALASIVLRDSAHLQEEDAENARLGGFSRHDPPRPLYDAADAETAIRSFKPVDYHQHFDLDSGAGLTLNRAGHILGSATAFVTIGAGSVLFSGDLAHKILAHTIRRTVTRGGPGRLSNWRPRQHQHRRNFSRAEAFSLDTAAMARHLWGVVNGVVVTRSQGEAGTRHE